MHSTESRIVTGPSSMLFAACMCARFSPENLRAGTVKGLKGIAYALVVKSTRHTSLVHQNGAVRYSSSLCMRAFIVTLLSLSLALC